jgi:protein SCO1
MRLATSLLSLLLVAVTGAAEAPALKAGVFSPPREAPDFTLQGSDGRELKLSRYRGKVVVMGFGFTSCPDVCPVTLGTLAAARRALGAAAADVQVIYVTVDPERDDAGRMRAYLRGFDPTFVGGTGTVAQIAAVRKVYGVFADRKPAGEGYSVAHSSFTYLIDRAGRIRGLMPYGHSPADYVHDLQILMNE